MKQLKFLESKCSFELMRCVSTYPMDTEDANLITINELKKMYNCDVGYSGHENGTWFHYLPYSLTYHL